MIQALENILDRLDRMPAGNVFTTRYAGHSGSISRAQIEPMRSVLAVPFQMHISRFKRDNTVQFWKARNGELYSELYRGSLPYHTQPGFCFQYVLRGQISKMMMGQPVTLQENDSSLIDMNCVHAELVDISDAVLFTMELRTDFFLPEMYDNSSESGNFWKVPFAVARAS